LAFVVLQPTYKRVFENLVLVGGEPINIVLKGISLHFWVERIFGGSENYF